MADEEAPGGTGLPGRRRTVTDCPKCPGTLRNLVCADCGSTVELDYRPPGDDQLALPRGEMRTGKYVRWAAELTPEQVMGVLWLVGEFSYRTSLRAVTEMEDRLHPRARAALKALSEATSTEGPMTVDEWRKDLSRTMRGQHG